MAKGFTINVLVENLSCPDMFFLFVVVVLFFVFFALTASHQDQKLAVNCDPLVIQICPAGVFVC